MSRNRVFGTAHGAMFATPAVTPVDAAHVVRELQVDR